MDFALRSAFAPAPRHPHASRPIGRRRQFRGRSSPNCAKRGRTASRLKRHCSRPVLRRRRGPVPHHRGDGRRQAASSARHLLGEPPGPKLELALERIFRARLAHGLDLDFHVDEAAPRGPLAGAHRRRAAAPPFQRPHSGGALLRARSVCRQRPRPRHRHRARGRITVVSLPMCDMYLQDRTAGARRALRGGTLHELTRRACRSWWRATTCWFRSTPMATSTCGGVPRGHPHPASRQSRRPWLRLLGARAAGIMGLADGARSRPAGRPISCEPGAPPQDSVAVAVRPCRDRPRRADRYDAARLSRAGSAVRGRRARRVRGDSVRHRRTRHAAMAG